MLRTKDNMHAHTHTHTHAHTYTHTTHTRLIVGLYDQRHKKVQDGVDEEYQKDGEEELAEYKDAIVII